MIVETQKEWHRLSDVRPDERRGTCAVCGPDTRLTFRQHRNQWACRSATNARSDAARARQREHNRRAKLLRLFGLTVEEFDALLDAQGGACAICESPCRTGKRLAVDHDHGTGDVRGLLCAACNRGLGYFRDDPNLLVRAAAYLKAPSVA